MSRPFEVTSDAADTWLSRIASMTREELVTQFRSYPAPFPIDFSDEFLASQSLDKLRHVFAGLVLHCNKPPVSCGPVRLAA